MGCICGLLDFVSCDWPLLRGFVSACVGAHYLVAPLLSPNNACVGVGEMIYSILFYFLKKNPVTRDLLDRDNNPICYLGDNWLYLPIPELSCCQFRQQELP